MSRWQLELIDDWRNPIRQSTIVNHKSLNAMHVDDAFDAAQRGHRGVEFFDIADVDGDVEARA